MRILFVCMGNICRSPTAEGVVRHLLVDTGLKVDVDSAGTHGYHTNHPPDRRATEAAKSRGIDLTGIRARRVVAGDFDSFDLILAMDQDNLMHLEEICPTEYHDKLALFMSYAPDSGMEEVPDPYYGGRNGFERVLDLVEDAATGLIEDLRRRAISEG
ncbi:MAG: low molecular weight phosphotyrosine protein phosphatase [Chromatiales bacterium]|nr:low molecular weight phosphotyrosine protein phosphatase [Rhodospirillales bacterium]MDH4030649.1 low molecular weight phosphotyrosine protein phosphatase [Chromatiales bacterium]